MPRHLLALTAIAATAAAQPQGSPLARNQFVAQMDAEFRRLDADKDGLVSRAEIEQSERAKAEASAQARNRAQFDELDTNDNGQLSPAEFAKLVPPISVSAQPMLTRMDQNRDQQLSLMEYRAATVANFDRLDRNRDGLVTQPEMQAAGIEPR